MTTITWYRGRTSLALSLIAALLLAVPVHGVRAASSLSFSNTPLLRPNGNSEPEISIGTNGAMAMVGLQWLFDPTSFGTNLWTGPFGSTPTFRGIIDAALQHPGKSILGAGDADVNLGSTGTLHATTLIFLFNAALNQVQFGVSAITCPNGTSSSFRIGSCTRQIIDTTTSDRPWITSDGPHVYISYHDSGASGLIHVQRSDDDGFTWQRVGDPIVGQDGATANATFHNLQGPIKADPVTHNVYDVYEAGETGVPTFTLNHIYVSRSTDMGKSWTANLIYGAPPGTSLTYIFPALGIDPTNGHLYAAWSDGHTVSFSASSDQGAHWSAPVSVNVAPATTAVFPWLAAYKGTVDLVYYGTTAGSNLDPSAVWNVYLAQTTNDGVRFTQSRVSNTPNHVGVVCTAGASCGPGSRNLLDLFQVAIDPPNSKAAVIYTDDTLTTTTNTSSFSCLPNQTVCPLPQVVLAQQQ
jgi:hypothetical protein